MASITIFLRLPLATCSVLAWAGSGQSGARYLHQEPAFPGQVDLQAIQSRAPIALAQLKREFKSRHLGKWPVDSGGWKESTLPSPLNTSAMKEMFGTSFIQWFHSPGESRWDALIIPKPIKPTPRRHVVWVRDAFSPQRTVVDCFPRGVYLYTGRMRSTDLQVTSTEFFWETPADPMVQPQTPTFLPMAPRLLHSFRIDAGHLFLFSPNWGLGYWGPEGLAGEALYSVKDGDPILGTEGPFDWYETRHARVVVPRSAIPPRPKDS